MPNMIKLVSWNVNSIRVRLPHLIELNEMVKPDIVMLQETKSTDDNFPFEDIKKLGFEIITLGQKSYNGVAVLSKLHAVGSVQPSTTGVPIVTAVSTLQPTESVTVKI